jgi:hypothetical protein
MAPPWRRYDILFLFQTASSFVSARCVVTPRDRLVPVAGSHATPHDIDIKKRRRAVVMPCHRARQDGRGSRGAGPRMIDDDVRDRTPDTGPSQICRTS